MKLSILYTLAAIANTEEKKGKYAWEDKKNRSVKDRTRIRPVRSPVLNLNFQKPAWIRKNGRILKTTLARKVALLLKL